MPAEFNTGFFVREPAWHKEGVVLPDYLDDIEEMYRLAGHNYHVQTKPLVHRGTTYDKYRVIERADDGTVLGVAGSRWTPIPNRCLWDVAEAYAGSGLKVDTAGVLRDGAIAWLLVKDATPVNFDGDPSEVWPYAMIAQHHDGSGGFFVRHTTVRVVCSNTFSLATNTGKAAASTIRHTSGFQWRVDDLQKSLAALRTQREEYASLARYLSNETPSVGDFVRVMFPLPEKEPGGNKVSRRSVTLVHSKRKSFMEIFEGPTNQGLRGGYRILQTYTEYLDHYAGQDRTRSAKVLLGANDGKKAEALETILSLV